MRLGDIKAEALRLMFVNFNQDVNAENLPELLTDETYASYLVNMNGSIMRGLERAAQAGKLGVKSFELPEEDSEGVKIIGNSVRYDLSKLLDDFYYVDKIVYDAQDWQAYNGYTAYRIEGKTIILPRLRRADESYRLLYHAMPPDVFELKDTDDVDIPERVARLLPYYIKGELYEEEEPSAAVNARNIFEQSLAEMTDTENTNVNQVQTVYSGSY